MITNGFSPCPDPSVDQEDLKSLYVIIYVPQGCSIPFPYLFLIILKLFLDLTKKQLLRTDSWKAIIIVVEVINQDYNNNSKWNLNTFTSLGKWIAYQSQITLWLDPIPPFSMRKPRRIPERLTCKPWERKKSKSHFVFWYPENNQTFKNPLHFGPLELLFYFQHVTSCHLTATDIFNQTSWVNEILFLILVKIVELKSL